LIINFQVDDYRITLREMFEHPTGMFHLSLDNLTMMIYRLALLNYSTTSCKLHF